MLEGCRLKYFLFRRLGHSVAYNILPYTFETHGCGVKILQWFGEVCGGLNCNCFGRASEDTFDVPIASEWDLHVVLMFKRFRKNVLETRNDVERYKTIEDDIRIFR